MNQYLAVTSNGLENLLVDELKNLGIENPKPVQAGVKFKATLEQAYRCSLWSRLASRFVRILSEFECNDDMDLYLAASAINWSAQFDSDKAIVVDFNGTNREIRNSQYGAMKVKDAIVDSFTKKDLDRPQIRKDQPDLRVHVRLHREKALLGIDMVGSGLHQRGYRSQAGRAPLRETLAAALLSRSGWDKTLPLLDPMCGSGTIVIEAAMVAANMAPGFHRQQWSFTHLTDFDAELWAEIKSEAKVKGRRGIKAIENKFIGYDLDSRMIKTAQDNARRAGLDSVIEFAVGDASKLAKPDGFENGVIVSNPPYGERLSTEPALIALYTAFGAQLKQEFQGMSASIFSSSEELLSCIGMRADKSYKLNNGAILCFQKNYKMTSRTVNKEVKSGQSQETVFVAPEFANRLKKNIGKIGKWARKEKLDCYRIYDADLPNYNVAIDVYPDHLVIQEYAAPKDIPEEVTKRRITDVIRACIQVTGVQANNVVLKVREKQKGRSQYQKLSQQGEFMEVSEYGVRLRVNLFDYLDTGLFLDHKLTRKMIGELADGQRFLNLFAYTGSATVHAACGGAVETTTVDMSKTYLAWAEENLKVNGISGNNHKFVQADCLQWLQAAQGEYDLIFIDPPTFSNSKRMQETFDVQRDHQKLIASLKDLLAPSGTIVFSNNKRHFKMDVEALAELDLSAKNISSKTLPLDFSRNKHIHNCWLITHVA